MQEATNQREQRYGLVCRKCGHRRFRVIYTRAAFDSKIVRRRACRKCDTRVTTWERVIGG